MMTKRIILMSLLAAFVVAQAKPARLPAQGQRRIQAVRIWKLTEALNLTDEQIDTFIPKLRKYEEALEEERNKGQAIIQEARDLLDKDKVSQKEVDKILKKAIEHRKKLEKLHADWLKQLPKYLTPRQQLKYLGFEMRFKRQLRRFLRERPGFGTPPHRPGPRRGMRMGPPDFYDD